MISNAQKALLHVARQRLEIGDENYRAILRAQAGVESSLDLDNAGFDRVLQRFEELGFTHPKPVRRRRAPGDPVTPEQQTRIAELYRDLGWQETARQTGFNRRCCKRSWPQTRSDGIKVIEGLKAVLKRRDAK